MSTKAKVSSKAGLPQQSRIQHVLPVGKFVWTEFRVEVRSSEPARPVKMLRCFADNRDIEELFGLRSN